MIIPNSRKNLWPLNAARATPKSAYNINPMNLDLDQDLAYKNDIGAMTAINLGGVASRLFLRAFHDDLARYENKQKEKSAKLRSLEQQISQRAEPIHKSFNLNTSVFYGEVSPPNGLQIMNSAKPIAEDVYDCTNPEQPVPLMFVVVKTKEGIIQFRTAIKTGENTFLNDEIRHHLQSAPEILQASEFSSEYHRESVYQKRGHPSMFFFDQAEVLYGGYIDSSLGAKGVQVNNILLCSGRLGEPQNKKTLNEKKLLEKYISELLGGKTNVFEFSLEATGGYIDYVRGRYFNIPKRTRTETLDDLLTEKYGKLIKRTYDTSESESESEQSNKKINLSLSPEKNTSPFGAFAFGTFCICATAASNCSLSSARNILGR